MNKNKIGFIGCGNMAKAIIKGIINSGLLKYEDIYIYDINKGSYNELLNTGINILKDPAEVVKNCNITFLAIKPQNYNEVLSKLKGQTDSNKVLVSIAAGVSIDYIKSKIECDCSVVRVMPNTPMLLGKGATAVCRDNKINESQFNTVKKIFKKISYVEEITEDKMNPVIAIHGSSPAYIYLFVKAVLDYADSVNIDKKIALPLICKTLEGSAYMLTDSGFNPDELIEMVTSKGGTTSEALEELKKSRFCESIINAMQKCNERAIELSNPD